MTVTPFQLDRGFTSGRVTSSTAAAGSYVFELGSAVMAQEKLEHDDKIELSQTVDQNFTTDKLLRCNVRLRAPVVATPGATWVFSVLYGAVTYYSRRIAADGRELELTRIAVPLVAEPQTLLFRLQLEIV